MIGSNMPREDMYKIVCIAQIYNELRTGNLERFVKYAVPLVDELVVYDDASIDGSYEYMLQHTPHIIRGLRNDFSNSMKHKQRLLDYALEFRPDFIFYLDADEVFSANAQTRLQELCTYCSEHDVDGLSFHKLNLWRSYSWRRIDNAYDDGWFTHLWRVIPGISYGKIKRGVHTPPYPRTVQKIERVEDVQVIHYGFASDRALAYKYLVYKSYGQSGWALDRFMDETTLDLEKVPAHVFPAGLFVDDEPPKRRSFEQALECTEKYRDEALALGIPIVTPTSQKIKWLRFIDGKVKYLIQESWSRILSFLRAHLPNRMYDRLRSTWRAVRRVKR